MERQILVVLAHPDDESMGMGGRIALHAREGTPITYLCSTRGQMGRHLGRPVLATRESLPILRERELREACRVLGIGDLRFLGLWDKTVEFEDPDLLARRIRAIIEELQPSLVLTYHPVHGGHQDHCAAGAAALGAVRLIEQAQRPKLQAIVHPKLVEQIQAPVIPFDIRPVADVKLAAVRAHQSQTQTLAGGWAWKPEAIERYRTEFPTEYFMDLLPLLD